MSPTPRTPSCDTCWFRQEMLCALALPEPCPTFRPASTGLRPPPQPPLLERVGEGAVAASVG